MLEAKVYPNQKGPKLFRNKLLESLSKSNIYVIDMMYLIIATGFITWYYYNIDSSVSSISLWFVSGFLSWTLAEYLMHRFLYHKINDASYDKGFQYIFHGIHHLYPNDEDRIVLPPVPSLLIATIFLTFFTLILGWTGIIFATGFMIGYVVYITIHWAVHHFPAPKKMNWWWKHHNIHHYQQHDKAFGVSSPLWDIIFRTMPRKNRRTIKIISDKNH